MGEGNRWREREAKEAGVGRGGKGMRGRRGVFLVDEGVIYRWRATLRMKFLRTGKADENG